MRESLIATLIHILQANARRKTDYVVALAEPYIKGALDSCLLLLENLIEAVNVAPLDDEDEDEGEGEGEGEEKDEEKDV